MAADEVANTILTIANVYKNNRQQNTDDIESFADYIERAGIAPFKEAVYG